MKRLLKTMILIVSFQDEYPTLNDKDLMNIELIIKKFKLKIKLIFNTSKQVNQNKL